MPNPAHPVTGANGRRTTVGARGRNGLGSRGKRSSLVPGPDKHIFTKTQNPTSAHTTTILGNGQTVLRFTNQSDPGVCGRIFGRLRKLMDHRPRFASTPDFVQTGQSLPQP